MSKTKSRISAIEWKTEHWWPTLTRIEDGNINASIAATLQANELAPKVLEIDEAMSIRDKVMLHNTPMDQRDFESIKITLSGTVSSKNPWKIPNFSDDLSVQKLFLSTNKWELDYFFKLIRFPMLTDRLEESLRSWVRSMWYSLQEINTFDRDELEDIISNNTINN